MGGRFFCQLFGEQRAKENRSIGRIVFILPILKGGRSVGHCRSQGYYKIHIGYQSSVGIGSPKPLPCKRVCPPHDPSEGEEIGVGVAKSDEGTDTLVLYLYVTYTIIPLRCKSTITELKDRDDIPLLLEGKKQFYTESNSPCNSLIGYSLKWRCCSLV